jgi:acetyl-CoA acetyltransferase
MKTYGLSHEQLAMVSVVQREWAAKNPHATFKAPITTLSNKWRQRRWTNTRSTTRNEICSPLKTLRQVHQVFPSISETTVAWRVSEACLLSCGNARRLEVQRRLSAGHSKNRDRRRPLLNRLGVDRFVV